MKRNSALRLAAVVSVAALLSTGCSLINKKESGQAIDPPPSGAESMMETASVPVNAANGRQVTLYFKDPRGMVAPVSVYVEKTVEVAKRSLEAMVDGAKGTPALPQGFTSLLPKGTVIKGIDIKDDQKLATVDFSKEFNNYKTEDERKVLEAVVWTLTGLDSVEKVSIRVEGKTLTEMAGAKTPVDKEMTRAMGINLEFASGMNLGQAVPVTLYFKNQTPEKYDYYVPVTRMVPRTDNLAKAAVEQLIKGPDAAKGLASVMASDIGLLQVKLSDDKSTITVDFNDKLLGSDKKVPAAAAQALILSLTETTGAAKVQLMVNGDVKVAGTDNTSYSKPVAAPDHINPVKM
ncbi:GerMN domain-containing protein [Gorillibacterium sp. sgz5001074]|uniref:GerMN domain-containing protein n=1 Tax=Gorillibacterium sp. sgz5001074 TaxID=3446695 RepID=UPI003F66E852